MLDGNRRWARSAGHDDLSEGYKVGGAKVAEFLRWCVAARIEHVTLFMLSNDNLHRPADELPDWCNVYEGLSDQEIDGLESIVLQRANLNRPFGEQLFGPRAL